MPLKVVHVTPVYPPYAGGIGVVAQMMANGLVTRGWDVDVVAPQSAQEFQGSNVTTLKPLFKIGNAAMVPQVRKLEGYDIIHLHYPFFGGAEWLLLKKTRKQENKKTKLILQYHHDADAGGLKGEAFKLYDKFILPRLIKIVDKVIVSSMDYARHSRVARFIDEKFVEIPLGVDTERFNPNGARFKLPDSKFTILFVGSLDRAHWFKGLEVLLNALLQLKKVMPISNGRAILGSEKDWHCSIIGDGDLRLQYEKQAHILGIADHVQFLGNVSHELLPDNYRTADCFVFPSVSRAEAFGLVVLEAMASGLPVIVSDLPGVRTLVQCHSGAEPSGAIESGSYQSLRSFQDDNNEEKCGFTCPIGDSSQLAEHILKLMQNEELKKKMGERARKRAASLYTWAHVIDKLEVIY